MIGIDEVGRGCLAGPLVAAAVIFPNDLHVIGLTDSKLLTKRQRSQMVTTLQELNLPFGIGWVWPDELNLLKLTESVRLAMRRALQLVQPSEHHIIIDGNINYLADIAHTKAIIKADGSVPAVSAASVIAKVARDQYMSQLAKQYPEYGFDLHVGYGTKRHLEALQRYGVTKEHRTFYKPIARLLAS